MARYGLMAGALSTGLEQALGGVNQGLLGGEDIRHRRAQEALQQQYYQMSQQQLMNQLAQHAFQNYISQQNLDLARKSEGRLTDAQQTKTILDAAAEKRAQDLAPFEIGYKKAAAGYMGDRSDIARMNEAGRMERSRMQYDTAMARLNDMQRRTTGYLARVARLGSDPALKAKAHAIDMRLRDIRQQMAFAARAAENQTPLAKGARSYEELATMQAELEGELDALEQQAGGGGGGGAPSKKMSLQDAIKALDAIK